MLHQRSGFSSPPSVARVLFGLVTLCAGYLFFFPPFAVTNGGPATLAIIFFTMLLWASGLLAESLTAILFFTFATLIRLAPPEIIFSGLTSSPFWLIFSGLVIGAAIRESGLGNHIAGILARHINSSYRIALTSTVLFGLAMSFLMPSAMGRILLILPILKELAEKLGHKQGSSPHTGLVIGGIMGTLLPSFAILPANIPNNILAGIIESTTGQALGFGDYFIVHFPILGLAKTILLLAVLHVYYRGTDKRAQQKKADAARPMSAKQKQMAILLTTALALWSMDGWHHVSPAWIGMAVAAICLLPWSGFLPAKGLQTINLEPLFYVGGVMGVGALLTHSGLSQNLAAWMLGLVSLVPGDNAINFMKLSGMSVAVGLLTTLPGIPAVLTPLSSELAVAAGFSTTTVLVTQVIGFSTIVLPYQAPPLILAMQSGQLPRRELTVLCLITAVLTAIVLWPLEYLWLEMIGLI